MDPKIFEKDWWKEETKREKEEESLGKAKKAQKTETKGNCKKLYKIN